MNNHPVHIVNDEGESSPSSFIPYCSFGEEFLGTKIDAFEIPVCDIFKPRNYFDQLCYETNLQDLKDSNSQKIKKQLEMGLTLVLDYNEERQSYKFIQKKNDSNAIKAPHNTDDSSFSVYSDTIGRHHVK